MNIGFWDELGQKGMVNHFCHDVHLMHCVEKAPPAQVHAHRQEQTPDRRPRAPRGTRGRFYSFCLIIQKYAYRIYMIYDIVYLFFVCAILNHPFWSR